MRAIISDDQWIYLENVTTHEDNVLWDEFSVSRPGYRFVDPEQRANLWDGIHRKYNRAKQRLARPLLSMLRGVCKEHGLPLDVVDRRPPEAYHPIDPELITPDFLPGITLDAHQVKWGKIVCRTECAICNTPTGGGKGEMIAITCKTIECPTVILADQRVVIDQLKRRLELRDIQDEIGLFYAGQRPNGELVVVGSIQSLTPPSKMPEEPTRTEKDTNYTWEQKKKRWEKSLQGWKTRKRNAKQLQDYVRKAHMLIVDECVDEHSWIATDAGLMRAADAYTLIKNGTKLSAMVGSASYPISDCSEKVDVTVKVTTKSGITIRSSRNHPFATFQDGTRVDKHAANLRPGDLLLASRRWPAVGYDKKWYHTGLFIGDGHFLDQSRVRFAVRKDIDDWRTVMLDIAATWNADSVKMGHNKRGDFVGVIASAAFCSWLRTLGFTPGRKMGTIDPKFVVPGDSAATGLLRGLFDAEGSPYNSAVKFDSSDKPLAEFAQQLCSYLGIGTSCFLSNKRTSTKHAPLWRVAASGQNARKWRAVVGFGFSRKSEHEAVESSIESERHIDSEPWIDKWLTAGIPIGKLAKIVGTNYCPRRMISLARLVDWNCKVRSAARCNPNDYAAAKLIFGISDAAVAAEHNIDPKTAWNRRKRGDDSLWRAVVDNIRDRLLVASTVDDALAECSVEIVKSITDDSETRLIDFTIPGIATFEANGVRVHNCDKATSDPWKAVFRHQFRGRRRYGFSGTPFDAKKPVEGLVMQEHLGSVQLQVSRKELVRIGRIVEPEYLTFVINGNIHEGSAFDIAFDTWVVKNQKIHNLYAQLCAKYRDKGNLILVDRVELGEAFVRTLAGLGIESHFIHGGTPKRRRNDVLAAFEQRKFNVLIGGKIINRGLDLAGGCDNLMLATSSKLSSDLLQKVGRALRLTESGKSTVYDLFFRCNKYLYSHSRDRLKIMVAQEYKTTVVLPTGTIDGEKLIKSRFRFPTKLPSKAAQPQLF